jgi:radical SAM superfamily enzyme YgiQ (UPF0313 family)
VKAKLRDDVELDQQLKCCYEKQNHETSVAIPPPQTPLPVTKNKKMPEGIESLILRNNLLITVP